MIHPLFIDILSGIFLIAAMLFAIFIAIDLKSRPQSMKIMGVVWVLTALWSSVLGLIAYLSFGRGKVKNLNPDKGDLLPGQHHSEACVVDDDDMKDMNMKDMDMTGMKMNGMSMDDMGNMKGMDMKRPKWQSIALSAMHCGAGCTLADIIGESYTGFHPIAIGGSFIIGAWVLDYILALIIGVYFQYVAIREMQNIKASAAFFKAFKADFLSLTSWQIGMYGWMAIVVFVIFKDEPLSKTSTDFWFMMQIAMLCGFITAYPMNALLIKLGIKKGM